MVITDNRTNDKIEFKKLCVGEVFELERGNGLFMKTVSFCDEFGSLVNAINLSSGTAHGFVDGKRVFSINCKLVIED